MTDQLFPAIPVCPESVLLSIYNAYPRKCNRKEALKRISEAIDRICAGEIDGQPRTQPEAIEFLRLRTEWFRREMFGREDRFIPHATTYFHGTRYLRPALDPEAMPAYLEAAVKILAIYPKMPDARTISHDVMAFLPALNAISKALERMEAPRFRSTMDDYKVLAERRLTQRTQLYAMAVAQWPAADLQYVPNPVKWFSEHRYEHDEATWNRQPANGFIAERDQLKRILQ